MRPKINSKLQPLRWNEEVGINFSENRTFQARDDVLVRRRCFQGKFDGCQSCRARSALICAGIDQDRDGLKLVGRNGFVQWRSAKRVPIDVRTKVQKVPENEIGHSLKIPTHIIESRQKIR